MKVDLNCLHCGFSKKVLKDKIPAGLRWITCQGCGQRYEFSIIKGERGFILAERGAGTEFHRHAAVHERGFAQGSPWERRSEQGFFRGTYQSFKAVLFSPRTFFKTLPSKAGMSEPFAFGLLLGALGNMLGFFWQFLILGGGLESSFPGIFEELNIGIIFLIIMAFVPLLVALAIFIVSGILHLMLLIVDGDRKGFEATFGVVSYSQAAQAWTAIPFVGGWIGGIWQVIILIIGLREMHRITYFRVIMAFAIPVALVFFIASAALIIFFIYVGEQGLDLMKVLG